MGSLWCRKMRMRTWMRLRRGCGTSRARVLVRRTFMACGMQAEAVFTFALEFVEDSPDAGVGGSGVDRGGDTGGGHQRLRVYI